MPKAIDDGAWPARRLVYEGYATISDLLVMSIDDVDEWCIGADFWHDVQSSEPV